VTGSRLDCRLRGVDTEGRTVGSDDGRMEGIVGAPGLVVGEFVGGGGVVGTLAGGDVGTRIGIKDYSFVGEGVGSSVGCKVCNGVGQGVGEVTPGCVGHSVEGVLVGRVVTGAAVGIEVGDEKGRITLVTAPDDTFVAALTTWPRVVGADVVGAIKVTAASEGDISFVRALVEGALVLGGNDGDRLPTISKPDVERAVGKAVVGIIVGAAVFGFGVGSSVVREGS